MKRKISIGDEEESRLSLLLFNKSKNFAEKLKANDYNEVHINQQPAWIDDDDDNFGGKPHTKNKADKIVKLKHKYESLMGTPKWATLKKKEETTEENDEVLRTVGHLHKKKSRELRKDYLEVKKFPKINALTGNEGPLISCVEFHPKMSVTLVAGQSGVVSLFSIGGDINNKLHSFKLKKWKVTSAQFTPDGSEAFIASKLNHSYCIYNLIKAEPKVVPLPQIVKCAKLFQLSTNGKYIATSDGFDEVYLMSRESRELLRALKHNTNVASLAFSHDCLQLYCYGIQGEVTIWDLNTFRALKKFYDHGCVTASCITTSPCGRLLATGSGEGIVNIYQTSNLTISEPILEKTISNLTTQITNIKFNPTTEILAISSSVYTNAVKFIHIPSYHVFINFPTQALNLYHVENINFSPNSGYMALSNNKGSALLYRLKHYKNY